VTKSAFYAWIFELLMILAASFVKPVIGIVELQRGSWYYIEVKGAEVFPSVVNGECQL
jgi:hypothetical protein